MELNEKKTIQSQISRPMSAWGYTKTNNMYPLPQLSDLHLSWSVTYCQLWIMQDVFVNSFENPTWVRMLPRSKEASNMRERKAIRRSTGMMSLFLLLFIRCNWPRLWPPGASNSSDLSEGYSRLALNLLEVSSSVTYVPIHFSTWQTLCRISIRII